MLITLNYAARCRECKKLLPVGAKARFYGRGRVYGTSCHDTTGAASSRPAFAPSHPRTRLGREMSGESDLMIEYAYGNR